MKFFNDWLDSLGQNPKTAVRDVIWFALRFYVLTYLVLSPIMLATTVLKPFLPAQPINPAKFPPTLFALFMAGFGIYMFCAVGTLLSLLGGWHKLARKFRAPRRFDSGELFKRQSGTVGACNYSRILTVRLSSEGFYVTCLFPFNIMHRPILIPWTEFQGIRQKRGRRHISTRFIIGSPKIASIYIENPKIAEAAKRFLPQFQFL